MKIFINSRAIKGPWGGANSFLNALCVEFCKNGIRVTHDASENFDIALLNALVPDVDLDFVKSIYDRKIPIIHRKVGYAVSGGPDMHKIVDGAVWGDRLQVEFTPFAKMTIFQSYYSRDVFLSSGFDGEYVVIPNGVDDQIFSPLEKSGFWGKRKEMRSFWKGDEPIKVIISTWSNAKTKGFSEYEVIDNLLEKIDDIDVTLVGRKPDDLEFKNINVCAALPHKELAMLLRRHHILLQLAQKETCSNALIEGINCGLPIIYLDSGSNSEIAGEYGAEYNGNFEKSVSEIKDKYNSLVMKTMINPYRMPLVAKQYLNLIHKVYQESH
ncbi:hypothetical protein QUF76_05450 [Desulfobacterales bacterium HSG16]|nr:hypothetical protein [Desulfobacterales bacterium HSG16]